jgi:hypothetical protein
MSLIVMPCRGSTCDGSVRFDPPTDSWSTRHVGRCDSCGSLYDLYGGEMRRFENHGSDLVPVGRAVDSGVAGSGAAVRPAARANASGLS